MENILDPQYWKERLEAASLRHHAIFRCSEERWRKIEDKHRFILASRIGQWDSILDAGCAWGRLLTLMPSWWKGDYLGIDISPDFVDLGNQEHPDRKFVVGDLRQIPLGPLTFDWAVLISIRPMVKRNLGEGIWTLMETELRRVARQLLYLEYDETDQGSTQ
jgi:SAM-dependent methyltransferase